MIPKNSTQEYQAIISSWRWKKLRLYHMNRFPICADCEAAGRTRLATEVHHIVPIQAAHDLMHMKALAYDPANLVSLCQECHLERHRILENHASREELKARAEETKNSFMTEWLGMEESGAPTAKEVRDQRKEAEAAKKMEIQAELGAIMDLDLDALGAAGTWEPIDGM